MPKNKWLTANKLIESRKKEQIFIPESFLLNLYAIVVRKIDFHAGERMLQRLPYVSLTPELAVQLRKQSLRIAERSHYYFQKTALEYSIRKWQKKIIDYTENQQRLPFPLYRLSDDWLDFLNQDYVPFQSARGEQFHMPTTLSADLAYFLGVVIGDGHLNLHNIVLVDFSENQMKYLQTLAQKLFSIVGPVTGEKKVWLLHLNNKWLVRLANFLTDQPITGKKYHALREPLIFQNDEHLRWQFWSGVLDADGSYINIINLCSSSEHFILAFAKVLDEYKVQYTIDHRVSAIGQGFSLRIKAASKGVLGKYLQPRHPKKVKDFLNYLSKEKKRNEGTLPFERLYIDSINPQTLIHHNNTVYFNFEFLHSFNVTNCSSYLQTIRKTQHWTQQDLADFLGIAKGRLASYEYRANLPIQFLVKLLPLLPNSPKHLMLFLQRNDHNYFRSRKTIARLDLMPSDKLLSLMKSLVFCKNYLLVKNTKDDKITILTELQNYFDLSNKHFPVIQNSVLYHYAKSFFLMRPVE